jgi:hypothetical protein
MPLQVGAKYMGKTTNDIIIVVSINTQFPDVYLALHTLVREYKWVTANDLAMAGYKEIENIIQNSEWEKINDSQSRLKKVD